MWPGCFEQRRPHFVLAKPHHPLDRSGALAHPQHARTKSRAMIARLFGIVSCRIIKVFRPLKS